MPPDSTRRSRRGNRDEGPGRPESPVRFWAAIKSNPIAAAAIPAATLAALSGVWVAWYNASCQRGIEVRRSEQQLILEMLRADGPEQAARNLDFLLGTGLLTDPAQVARLDEFLKIRKPGGGPYLTGPEADRYWVEQLLVDSQRSIAKADAWLKAHPRESPTPGATSRP